MFASYRVLSLYYRCVPVGKELFDAFADDDLAIFGVGLFEMRSRRSPIYNALTDRYCDTPFSIETPLQENRAVRQECQVGIRECTYEPMARIKPRAYSVSRKFQLLLIPSGPFFLKSQSIRRVFVSKSSEFCWTKLSAVTSKSTCTCDWARCTHFGSISSNRMPTCLFAHTH